VLKSTPESWRITTPKSVWGIYNIMEMVHHQNCNLSYIVAMED